MPWEEGEDAWLALRRPDLEDMTKTSDGGGPDAAEDVPAEMLADDDSKFMELSPGVKVHYKEVAPPAMTCSAGAWSVLGGPEGASTGIVLVHGFGGGVFSWRHIKETLAMQCHCRVIAFDRPAFGELGFGLVEQRRQRRKRKRDEKQNELVSVVRCLAVKTPLIQIVEDAPGLCLSRIVWSLPCTSRVTAYHTLGRALFPMSWCTVWSHCMVLRVGTLVVPATRPSDPAYC